MPSTMATIRCVYSPRVCNSMMCVIGNACGCHLTVPALELHVTWRAMQMPLHVRELHDAQHLSFMPFDNPHNSATHLALHTKHGCAQTVWQYEIDNRDLSGSLPSFIVGRNPYVRLLSGFLDKLVARQLGGAYKSQWNLWNTNEQLGRPRESPFEASPAGFAQFVRALSVRGVTDNINVHWRMTSRACDLHSWRYEYYLQLERIGEWLPCMAQARLVSGCCMEDGAFAPSRAVWMYVRPALVPMQRLLCACTCAISCVQAWLARGMCTVSAGAWHRALCVHVVGPRPGRRGVDGPREPQCHGAAAGARRLLVDASGHGAICGATCGVMLCMVLCCQLHAGFFGTVWLLRQGANTARRRAARCSHSRSGQQCACRPLALICMTLHSSIETANASECFYRCTAIWCVGLQRIL